MQHHATKRARLPRLTCLVSAALAIAGLLAGSACNPVIEFDVAIESDSIVEQGSVFEELLGDFGFEEFATVDVSDSQAFENNDVRKEQVTEVRATRIELSIADPADADFDFIDELSFLVEAPDVAKEKVAGKAFPRGARVVELDLEALDLAPYVRAPSLSLTTEATARRPPADTTVHAEIVLRVKAEAFAR